MKTSATLVEIVKALSKAQGEFGKAVYDRTNPHFKSKYASLESVHSAIKGPLSKHGLAISHLIEDNKMVTTLFHDSGEWLGCEIAIPQGLTPQQLGSMITYLRRYSLCCLLAIPTGEEDDDGNLAETATQVQPFIGLSEQQCFEIESLVDDDSDLGRNILRGYGVKSFGEIESRHFKPIIETLKKRLKQ